MGTEISALLSNAGHSVTLLDIKEESLKKARRRHEKVETDLKDAGILKKEKIPSRISYTTSKSYLEDCEFITEAIDEKLQAKRKLVSSLEKIISKDCIIATNTSTYTVTEIAENMDHPERVILMHFANPPIPRDFVEVAKGRETSDETLNFALQMADDMEKTPVVPSGECRGYILNRLVNSGEVATAYEYVDGAQPAEVDQAFMELGSPIGIFEYMDIIGVDIVYETCKNLEEVHGERFKLPEKFCSTLREMIDRGDLGKKTGKGFYKWSEGEAEIPETSTNYDIYNIVAVGVNEAFRIVDDGIGDRETVDKIYELATDTAGIFKVGELTSFQTLKEKLENLYNKHKNKLFKPCKNLKMKC